MDAVVVGNESLESAAEAVVVKASVASDFWDMYQEFGMVEAVNFMDITTGNDVLELEALIPGVMAEAQVRGIDMVQFIKEWDEHTASIHSIEVIDVEDELAEDSCPV